MKRIFIMLLMSAFVCLQVNAQDKTEKTTERQQYNPEMMVQRQSSHIISTLGLAGDVADQFSELYAAYKKEMVGVKDQYPMIHRWRCKTEEGEQNKGLTDEEIEKNILNRFAQSRATLDIREKYYQEFRKILTPGQIQAMYSAEKQHAARMEQYLRHKREAALEKGKSRK